jgi:hypothetical protein
MGLGTLSFVGKENRPDDEQRTENPKYLHYVISYYVVRKPGQGTRACQQQDCR